jgi:hypothetical protein
MDQIRFQKDVRSFFASARFFRKSSLGIILERPIAGKVMYKTVGADQVETNRTKESRFFETRCARGCV